MESVEPIDRTSAARLAELVVHLTDCDPQQAVGLIDLADPVQGEAVDKLAIVARAMVRLRRGATARPPKIDLRDAHDLRDEPAMADLRDDVTAASRRDGRATY